MQTQQAAEFLPIGEVVAAVRRTYPEVSHSSLRFLEREGLIAPARTPGGHRLFTADDVDRILRIKAWQAQRLSLDEIRRRLAARGVLAPPAVLAERFLVAGLEDEPAARRVVLEADELGMPLARQFQAVIRPAMAEVGARWASGALRVGQEHALTELTRALIAELAPRHRRPLRPGRPGLAATVAGEHHDLGLRMIVALVQAEGLPVHFLGADVEARFLAEEVETRRPGIVLLSATLAERLPAVRMSVEAIRAAAGSEPPRIVLGGQVVAGRRDELAAWGVVPVEDDDLDAAVATILTLMGVVDEPEVVAANAGRAPIGIGSGRGSGELDDPDPGR